MSFAHIFLLAAIQGLTEFIPVSSSGHLNLVHAVSDLPDLGVGLDVALHAGTLLAVMVYFRRDTGHLIGGGVDILRRRKSPAAQQSWMIILATVPVLLAAAALMASGWLTFAQRAGDCLGQYYFRDTAVFGRPLWEQHQIVRNPNRAPGPAHWISSGFGSYPRRQSFRRNNYGGPKFGL